MKKSRFTEERIVRALRQAEAGTPLREVCRKRFGLWKAPNPRSFHRALGERVAA